MKKWQAGKLLSMLLAVIMIIGTAPLGVFAATAGELGYEVVDEDATSGESYELNPNYDYYVAEVDGNGDIVAMSDPISLADGNGLETPEALATYNSGAVTPTTTAGSTTYTLDTDGVDSGAKYLIVAQSIGYAAYVKNEAISPQQINLGNYNYLIGDYTTAAIDDNEAAALWTITGSGTTYSIKNVLIEKFIFLTISKNGNSYSSSFNLQSDSATVDIGAKKSFGSYTGNYYIRTISPYKRYGYFYYNNYNNGFTTIVQRNSIEYIRLYKQTITPDSTVYNVDRTGLDALLTFVGNQTIIGSHYTAASYEEYTTALAAANAVTVNNPYTNQTTADDKQTEINNAATDLYKAYIGLTIDPNAPLATFRIVNATDYIDYSDYNDGTLSAVTKDSTTGKVTCTATPNAGNRFAYWTKNVDNERVYVSSSATLTVDDDATEYIAWFIKDDGDGTIYVPITWERTDEQTIDTDNDDSSVINNIDTYLDYPADWTTGNVYYGVTWDRLKELHVSGDAYVWDFEKNGTDGDNINYQYGAYTNNSSYTPSVIAASWKDLDTTSSDEWKHGSARMFRGKFFWPEGYTTSDVIKMMSVNDSNYQFIYDYINTYIENNPDDTAFINAFKDGSVLPINDDMFIYIHRADEDLVTHKDTTTGEPLTSPHSDYLTFFTGTTGKGVWSFKGNTSADWGKTVEPLLFAQYSIRAFRWTYPNLINTAAQNSSLTSITQYTDEYYSLQHTDGWYTVLNTSTLASNFSSVYGTDATFEDGTEFYFDIYVVDNSGSGGMDKWDLNFEKNVRTVTVNYYYDTVDAGHFLGMATISGKVTDDQITLASGTLPAQLNYKHEDAQLKIAAGDESIYLDGEQQGVIPYVVENVDNVINVLYIKIPKSGMFFKFGSSTYVYDGIEKTLSTVDLYFGGVLQDSSVGVTKAVTNTDVKWTLTVNETTGQAIYITTLPLYTVTGTYVGTYQFDTSSIYAGSAYTGMTMTRNGNDYKGNISQIAPVYGELTITPAKRTYTYDYGVTNSYGTGEINAFYNGKPVTFTPESIGAQSASAIDVNDDNVADVNVTFIPATTVLYEEDFKNAEGENVITFRNYGATWQSVGTTLTGNTVVTDNESSAYGYTAQYPASAEYSGGSAMKTTVSEGKFAIATFQFTGTGFDIISETLDTTGLLTCAYKKQTEETYHYIDVNTYYGYVFDIGSGTYKPDNTPPDGSGLYQIPVINFNGDYDTYDVMLIAKYYPGEDILSIGSYDVYIDAIRIYNTLPNTTKNTQYLSDKEDQPVFKEIRDSILDLSSGTAWTDGSGNVVYIDGDYTSGATSFYEYGPKNEVYLKNNQTIAFRLVTDKETNTIGSVQIGAKAVTSAIPTLSVRVGSGEAKTTALTTATDMYYVIEGISWGYQQADGTYISDVITITNADTTNNSILSVTNIKVTERIPQDQQNLIEELSLTEEDMTASVYSALRTVSFYSDEETYAAALTAVETEPEVFEPETFTVSVPSAVKIKRYAVITVKTSSDVKYLIINGERITASRSRRGILTWQYYFTATAAGTYPVDVIAVNEDGVQSETVSKTITVTNLRR